MQYRSASEDIQLERPGAYRRNSPVQTLGSSPNLWAHPFVSTPTSSVSLEAAGVVGSGSRITKFQNEILCQKYKIPPSAAM